MSTPDPVAPARGTSHLDVDGTTLVDVLDRVIDRGAVVVGDLVLGVAGVDLVYVGLRLVVRAVDEPVGR